MASHYGWIIDKDHLYEQYKDSGTGVWDKPEDNEAGTYGPSDISEEMAETLKNTKEGKKFRLFDDDRNLYYSGRYLGELDGETGDPLMDFGLPNAGCSYMSEFIDGKWEITLG
jgi:hypothetical protein